MENRIDKNNYYLNIAEEVSERSTCLRRKYGAIIVNNDSIISTGYNGAPRGRINCISTGTCIREVLKIPAGKQYEMCRAVHAEQNALINAARKDMIGATLYLTGLDKNTGEYTVHNKPCKICTLMIANAGITSIITRKDVRTYSIYGINELLDMMDMEVGFNYNLIINTKIKEV